MEARSDLSMREQARIATLLYSGLLRYARSDGEAEWTELRVDLFPAGCTDRFRQIILSMWCAPSGSDLLQ